MKKESPSTPKQRPKYLTSGDRNSWPRKLARQFRRLPEAVEALQPEVDEYNWKHAITEFCEERIRMSKGLK